jgi:histidyl-tRNA synthetase
MEILIADKKITAPGPDAFIIHAGEAARDKAVSTCMLVRKSGFSAEMEPAPKGFKTQLKKADREKASLALIIGEDELVRGSVTVKDLKTGVQEMIKEEALIGYMRGKLGR